MFKLKIEIAAVSEYVVQICYWGLTAQCSDSLRQHSLCLVVLANAALCHPEGRNLFASRVREVCRDVSGPQPQPVLI